MTIQTQLFPNSDVVRVRRPGWLPDRLLERLSREKRLGHSFGFSRAERKTMRKRKPILVSEWSARHRIVHMSSLPGPWRNEVTPHMTGIMDAAQFSSVREISLCKGPQSAGSEGVHNFIGWAIDRDPGPVLYTYPDELTAGDNARDRILPMIKSSPRLRSYLSGRRDDESTMRINLQHMPIYLAWARSASRLGNRPIKYGVADEVDKYPVTAGKKESSPLDLMDKRFTVYRQVYKFFKISTPTTEDGAIWVEITQNADVLFRYWVKCPDCEAYQLMIFDGIQWPEDCRDPRRMLREKLAWYECVHCGSHWDERKRMKALAAGQWRSDHSGEWRESSDKNRLPQELFSYLTAHLPRHIGFHIPSWISPFVSMSECAAAFLEGLADFQKLKNFMTQIKAEPWRQVTLKTDESEFKKACCDLEPQLVPAEAIAITAGIDRQLHGFWFAVRAWAPDYTSWLIHYGYLAAWLDVERLLFETAYPVAGDRRKMRIWRAALDIGGGDNGEGLTMTEESYHWLRRNGVGRGCRVWGTKGASWPQVQRIKVGRPIDKTPSGKPLPGGLQILLLDTGKLKDAFFYRISQAAQQGPQAAYLHKGVGSDYFAHITAEEKQRDENGVEKWVQKRKRNDLLDCECMAAACADPEWPEGGIHLLRPPEEPVTVTPKSETAGGGWIQNREYQRPGWLNRG